MVMGWERLVKGLMRWLLLSVTSVLVVLAGEGGRGWNGAGRVAVGGEIGLSSVDVVEGSGSDEDAEAGELKVMRSSGSLSLVLRTKGVIWTWLSPSVWILSNMSTSSAAGSAVMFAVGGGITGARRGVVAAVCRWVEAALLGPIAGVQTDGG